MRQDIADLVAVASDGAVAAGAFLRSKLGRVQQVSFKGPTDIVTEADRLAEPLIVERLRQATPTYGFLTEENAPIEGDDGARWIVDPLDGTVNYARGYPHFCVCIALERYGQLELGVTYDPVHEELYVARRGSGATLNGAAIHVADTPTLLRATVSTGFPYSVTTDDRDHTAEVAYLVRRVQALRITGSAGLDLAAVACGRRDAHWERGLAAYDVAAGMLLVREAGGIVTDYAGRPQALHTGEVIAASPAVHREILAYFERRRTNPLA